MTQVGEGIAASIIQLLFDDYLFVGVESVTFGSGVRVYEVGAGGTETEVPAAGTPHWTPTHSHPAVYVRQGGAGETKALKVRVEWSHHGRDGAARLKGVSSDGTTVIEGDFTIAGARGSADVACELTKRPATVANYGRGLGFTWTVTAGGETATAPGGTPLRLFFVDARPKPIAWGGEYVGHYLPVVDWATRWASGTSGGAAVLAAIWDKFSDGAAARVPHATGFAYWKTNDPAQNLRDLLDPDFHANVKGWSCRAIAHTFMECLALHGIQCLEVIPNTAPGTRAFLVHNWTVRATTIPNWAPRPELYYAGSWVPSDRPPLNTSVPTSLKKLGPAGPSADPLEIDMLKRPGVPAQGQRRAPLLFSNHWIVEVGGQLYDTSYGIRHANDFVAYARTSLGGWLVGTLADTYEEGWLWWVTSKASRAFVGMEISTHALVRQNGASN
jgi:hypothetical protein